MILVTLIILVAYCLAGFIYGYGSRRLVPPAQRREWIILSLVIWPFLLVFNTLWSRR